MELGMASAPLSLHESHNVWNDPTCAGGSSVLDSMRDFDFEWAGSNDFAPLPYDFEHANLARQRDADSEKIPTTSASLLGEFSCPQSINQSSQTNTSMGSFSKTSTYSPSPLGIVASKNTRTISPSQTNLDHRHFFDIYSSVSGESEQRPSLTLQSSYSSMISLNNESLPSRKHGIVSDKADSDSDTPSSIRQSSIRGRRPSPVEPGSARAIYLEKSRKAAIKCRSKQKKQQENLVETARDMERKNKQLKAEVELLKGDMRDLMGIVTQHSSCPDQRLSNYVQHEADRLAARGSLSPEKSEKSPEMG